MMQPSPTIATPTTVTTLTPLTEKIAAAEEARRLDVAEMHEKVRGIFATIMASEVAFAKKHGVQFYENVVNTNPNNQQQMKGSCMCCGLNVFSTGSFKFAEHLMKCALCPREVRNAFLALSEKTEGKRAEKRDIELMATEEAQLAAQDHAQRQAQLKQQCIKAGIKNMQVDTTDLAIANFFYANAIPFSVASAEPDSLYRKMVSAIQAAPSGYVPPRFDKLAGPCSPLPDEQGRHHVKACAGRGRLLGPGLHARGRDEAHLQDAAALRHERTGHWQGLLELV